MDEKLNQRTCIVNFRLTIPERKGLELLAIQEGRSTLGEVLREVVREAIEKRLQKPIGLIGQNVETE
jgi:hypothetical protein